MLEIYMYPSRFRYGTRYKHIGMHSDEIENNIFTQTLALQALLPIIIPMLILTDIISNKVYTTHTQADTQIDEHRLAAKQPHCIIVIHILTCQRTSTLVRKVERRTRLLMNTLSISVATRLHG